MTTTPEWISKLVPHKSFAEVGGLWGDNNVLLQGVAAGAKSLCMVDYLGPESHWHTKFHEHCKKMNVHNVKEVIGNIDDNDIVQLAGTHDVVYCAGVLYHCPNPILTLRNLLAITIEHLILGTCTLPSVLQNEEGTLNLSDEVAYFLPGISEKSRKIIVKFHEQNGIKGTHGLDTVGSNMGPWISQDGSYNYAPWWWLWTPGFVKNMMTCFPVEILEEEVRPTCTRLVCRKKI